MTWRSWTTFCRVVRVWGIPYFFIKLALVRAVTRLRRLESHHARCCGTRSHRMAARTLWPTLQHKGRSLRSPLPNWSFRSTHSLAERWISSSRQLLIATVPLTVVIIARYLACANR